MAIRTTFSNRGNQRSAGRPQNRNFAMRQQQRSPEFEQRIATGYVPERNDGLMRRSEIPANRPFEENIGVTADTIELVDNAIKLHIPAGGEVIRDNARTPLERLSTREDLVERPVISERHGKALRVNGDISVDVATALSIVTGEGEDRRERVMLFRRPHVETVKGSAGPVGYLRGLPGTEIRRQIGEEHLMFAKKGGVEGIISLEKTEEARRSSVYAAKERVLETLRDRLQALLVDPAKNRDQIHQLNGRIAHISKFRPIFALSEEGIPDEVKSHMQTIETDFGGHKEKIQGYTRFDPTRKTLTIARQVRINPEAHGYRGLEIIDATGQERDLRAVDAPERSMPDVVQAMVNDVYKPKTVQGPDKTVVAPGIVEARMLADLYGTPPSFEDIRPTHAE